MKERNRCVKVKAVEVSGKGVVFRLGNAACIRFDKLDMEGIREFFSYLSKMDARLLEAKITKIKESRKNKKMVGTYKAMLEEARKIKKQGISYSWSRIRNLPLKWFVRNTKDDNYVLLGHPGTNS